MAENATPNRVFKIAATRIVEDASMAGVSIEGIRELLKTSYPEVANAVIRERDENGMRIIEFLPQPGRKG